MSIKHQLEASVMLDKLGVEILAGEEAADRFDADRQARAHASSDGRGRRQAQRAFDLVEA